MSRQRNMATYLMIFLLFAAAAYALGASPAKTTLNFEAGTERSIKLTIINNERKDMTVAISFEGDLAKYMTTKQEMIQIKANEGEKQIEVKLQNAKEAISPGENRNKIVLMEMPQRKTGEAAAVVSATTTVSSLVIVKTPYPETYAEAKLYVTKAEPNEYAIFTIPIFNLGSSTIEAWAEIKILDTEKKIVDTISTGKTVLEKGGEGKLQRSWLATVEPGEYIAEAKVYYNDKEIGMSKVFEVGTMLVDIYRIDVTEFKLGDIAKFNIYLKNRWNKNIENAYAEITILDSTGKEYTNYKTATTNLEPFKIQRMEAYWDTNGVATGKYELKMFLYYLDKMFEDSFTMQVREDAVEINIGPTAAVVGGNEGAQSKVAIYVLLVLILVVSNAILWVLYFKRIRKSKQP
jgi:hypothetical protein